VKKCVFVSVLVLSGSLLAWTAVPIDTAGPAARGWWTSLVVRGDTLHVAYGAHTNSNPLQTDIRYARSTDLGATWTIERVDSAANYGSSYALLGWWRGGLDLDTLGRPHVAYTVEASVGSFCTRAVRLGSGNWRLDTVEMRTSQPLVCHDADLQIDRTGRTHVVYTYYGYQTRYAVETTSGWEINDLNYGASYGVGLALDSLSNPHVVIGTLSDVRYGYSSDGGENWLTEVVGSGWWHVDICLAAAELPVISYTELSTAIRFGRRDGANNWFTTQVDAGGPNCCRPTVFWYQPDNGLHVSYYPYMNSTELKHALSTNSGSGWTPAVVGTTGGVYSSCSAPDYVETRRGRFIAGQWPGYKLGLYYELSTGVEKEPAAALPSLRVCPSPAFGRAWVEQARGAVSVADVSGRVRLTAPSLSGRAELDLSSLEPGVYVVSGSGTAPGKLIVSR